MYQESRARVIGQRSTQLHRSHVMSCTGSIDIGLCHGLKDVGVLCVTGFQRPLFFSVLAHGL
ncbi:unnamed protein product [Brassica oleracea]